MCESLFHIVGIAGAIKIVVIACIVFVAIGYACVIQFFGKLWLQARLSGAPISFAELIGMTLRKVNIKTIVVSRITAVQAGIDLSTAQLETHHLAGGNVPNVVRAMIILDKAGISPGWETLTCEDLQGVDVLEEAQQAAARAREKSDEMNDENEEYVEDDEASEMEYE